MRALVSLVITLAIILAAYYFYFQRAQQPGGPGSSGGMVPTQSISVTGVKNDLIAIAQAERAWFAEHGSYASLEELTSGGALTLKSAGRGGYVYTIDVAPNGFTATARYQGPPGLNYPTLSIDQTMQINEGR